MAKVNTLLIEVSAIQVEDSPNSVAFMFEPVDGSKMTAQQMLDALADFFLVAREDIFVDRNEAMH